MRDYVYSELPHGWANTTLGVVVEPRMGKTDPRTKPNAKFIGLEHIEAHSMKLLGTIPADSMKSSANVFRSGDVLYGRLRSYLNKVHQPSFKGLCSGEFIVMPESVAVSGKFLKYRLNACDLVRFASRANTGDRPRVDFNQISSFGFILPPKSEQIRIADTLDELFSDLSAGVAALERVRDRLKLYRASLLKAAVEGALTAAWREQHPDVEPADELLKRILVERRHRWEQDQLRKFEEKGKTPPKNWKAKYKEPVAPDTAALPSLPKGWCWASLNQITEIVGGVTKGQKIPDQSPTREVPYLRVANVQRGYLDLAEIKRIRARESEIDMLLLKLGDILFTEGGDRDKLGRGWVWSGEIDECVHQNHVFRARLSQGRKAVRKFSFNQFDGAQVVPCTCCPSCRAGSHRHSRPGSTLRH